MKHFLKKITMAGIAGVMFVSGGGLVLVEGNAGGKTVYTDLIEVIDP